MRKGIILMALLVVGCSKKDVQVGQETKSYNMVRLYLIKADGSADTTQYFKILK